MRLILTMILFSPLAYAGSYKEDYAAVKKLAEKNDFKPSDKIIRAILVASYTYKINPLELATIGIVETGLGEYNQLNKNKDGTYDKGIFQVNSINWPKCLEYNLSSPEGSSLCAAKLLHKIKKTRSDYMGVYHSKTPAKKAEYLERINKVLAKVD